MKPVIPCLDDHLPIARGWSVFGIFLCILACQALLVYRREDSGSLPGHDGNYRLRCDPYDVGTCKL